jgi:hypothetical protein
MHAPSHPRTSLRLALTALALAGLACNLLTDLELPDPEGLATDAFGTFPPPTAAPATAGPAAGTLAPDATPSAGEPTPGPGIGPALELPFTLDEADDAVAAMRPEFAGDVDLLPNATRYVIAVDVAFASPTEATLTGRSAIRYTNPYDFELAELYLMLWPNEPNQYLSDMTLDAVSVNGQPAQPELEHDNLAARLPLAEPLAPGAVVELETDFTVQVFDVGNEGLLRFGLTRGVLLAPSFYPLIPRVVDGAWQVEPPPEGGDTTNSDSAYYAWQVTAPADLAVAASGSVVEEVVDGGRQRLKLVTGPMRDLALTVGPLERFETQVDDIVVNAYLLAENRQYAREMLRQAEIQMATLQDLVGPYPFAELDIVDAPGAFGGIEYPGLVYIGRVENGQFEEANVHEIGHQWFYSLIGDDQLLEPWLDEAGASYTEVLYAEAAYGPQSRANYVDGLWDFVSGFSAAVEEPIGLPVDAYDNYSVVVYLKGLLFFDTLRAELGDEVFFNFLRAYYAEHRYGFATSQSFQASAEAACGCDLDELFRVWVYEGGEVQRP